MDRAWALALILLAASAAGCLSGGDETVETTAPAPNGTTSEPSAGAGSSGGAGAADADASEPGPVEAPAWEVGTWWRYRVEHTLIDEPLTVTLVVTDVSSQAYTVGWAEAEPGLRTLNFHLPPVGELTRPDLASWWHGERGRILDFPLEDGKTWQGTLGSEQVSMQAERNGTFQGAPSFTLTGTGPSGNLTIRAEYSPAVGFYHSIERFFPGNPGPSPGVYLEETGGPEGISGTIHVPAMTDALHADQVGPDPETGRPPAGETAGRFTVDIDADRKVLVLGAFLGGASGVYEATWRPEDGGPIVAFAPVPPSSDAIRFVQQLEPDPARSWEYSLSAAGPGIVFSEAISVGLTNATVPAR